MLQLINCKEIATIYCLRVSWMPVCTGIDRIDRSLSRYIDPIMINPFQDNKPGSSTVVVLFPSVPPGSSGTVSSVLGSLLTWEYPV
jgi:hypothetical protein